MQFQTSDLRQVVRKSELYQKTMESSSTTPKASPGKPWYSFVDTGLRGSDPAHDIYCYLDVTKLLQELQSQQNGISLTAYLIACLARAIMEDPKVGNKHAVFHEVDVITMIKPEGAGAQASMSSEGAESKPFCHIIRQANMKSVEEIHNEIQEINRNPEKSPQHKYGLAEGRCCCGMNNFPWLKRGPFRSAEQETVILSSDSVGLRSKHATVIFGSGATLLQNGGSEQDVTFLPLHAINVIVGHIETKLPAVHEETTNEASLPAVDEDITMDEKNASADILTLTLAFDHDIIDSGPATEFASRFLETVEDAKLLESKEESSIRN